MNNAAKVALVTGGSSGIGLCCVQALLDKGWKVYELSRREQCSHGGVHIKTDVTDLRHVSCAIDTVFQQEGRIDLVVNNAGFGISGAVEFTDSDEAKRLFDVNFFGMVNVNRAALPIMHQAHAGRIINISSVAAIVPIPFQTYYSASKSAVSSYTQALANEVRPYGISVCALMPGDIKTGFTASRVKSSDGDDVYGGRITRSVEKMEKDEQKGMPAETVGRYIVRLAEKKRVKPLYTLGFSYKCISLLVRLLPSALLNRIVAMLYSK